jgi:SpoVK/Ycf46/Vps4 family AAA+-type ATPase
MISELSNIDPTVGVIFFAPTGAELKGKYVGETEKNIVKYFSCAARAACQRMEESYKNGSPKKFISILFIDEFDNVGGDRMEDPSGLMANSVNTILQMMDGVQSFKNVGVIAATNYPWKLDAAILRRFNSQIKIYNMFNNFIPPTEVNNLNPDAEKIDVISEKLKQKYLKSLNG